MFELFDQFFKAAFHGLDLDAASLRRTRTGWDRSQRWFGRGYFGFSGRRDGWWRDRQYLGDLGGLAIRRFISAGEIPGLFVLQPGLIALQRPHSVVGASLHYGHDFEEFPIANEALDW